MSSSQEKVGTMRLIIIGALAESLINFRGHLIKAFVSKNCEVVAMAATSPSTVIAALKTMNVEFKEYPIQRNGMNPLVDYKTVTFLRQFFLQFHADIILAYTIKPVIWGGIASRVLPNTRFFALITGLGFAFNGKGFVRGLLSSLVARLYKFSLTNARKVIFQNPDNLREFVKRGIVPQDKCVLVNGSGVDVVDFSYTPVFNEQRTTFLTIGRLLGEKGFREYAEAAQLVKKVYPDTIFQLLGPVDPSPDGLAITEVEAWHNQGVVEYLGSASDVRPYIKKCHIYVLPSYHEGMPRTVLESMAIGRPILTTDVPGCRETVVPGKNGFLVPSADATALAERMIWFIEHRDHWAKMGECSREMAEKKFDVTQVNAQIMAILGV
ncbi:glycosyltransferase family 4 protein [sulfur-oxidizing endosymbiont of Gigantopelta aegis]|uniref:glycosyltransferase family 4 protein n=1 Tax=sulfur-oxidizing endosymbiont of Gigantopelta aegis TaxID=2794934 RepID=UPI001FE7F89C|nr:glycosyltransferase family 4 protein [sulfur-oxidizing endosymbiont of Gigantopelta aegis]